MGDILKFDNVLNVRDFGGQAVTGGGRVIHGKLYRGAQLSNMSARDGKRFTDFGVSLLVDMRYRSERERQSTKLGSGFAPEIFTLLKQHDQRDADAFAPHEMFIIHELGTEDDARRYMMESYTDRPQSPAFISLTSRSLKQLAQNQDTLYVHCAAGKDRTGTFAAILLMILGVSPDDVMEDYMRTKDVVDFHLIVEMTAKKMEERYGRPYDNGALLPFFGVEPDFLMASLNIIGDIQKYVHDVLGLTTVEIDSLKRHYIV